MGDSRKGHLTDMPGLMHIFIGRDCDQAQDLHTSKPDKSLAGRREHEEQVLPQARSNMFLTAVRKGKISFPSGMTVGKTNHIPGQDSCSGVLDCKTDSKFCLVLLMCV